MSRTVRIAGAVVLAGLTFIVLASLVFPLLVIIVSGILDVVDDVQALAADKAIRSRLKLASKIALVLGAFVYYGPLPALLAIGIFILVALSEGFTQVIDRLDRVATAGASTPAAPVRRVTGSAEEAEVSEVSVEDQQAMPPREDRPTKDRPIARTSPWSAGDKRLVWIPIVVMSALGVAFYTAVLLGVW